MHSRILRQALAALAIALIATAPAHAQLPTIAPNLARTSGIDSASGIAYARFYTSATPSADPSTLDLTQPTLTVQCSKSPDGKFTGELLVNFGHITDTTFYPPWKKTQEQPEPPPTSYIKLSMQFIGPSKPRPLKREFEYVRKPLFQLRFNPVGPHSSNMEPTAYIFAYLRSFPTLQLTGPDHGQKATFNAAPMLDRIRTEPLCQAIAP